MVEIPDVAHHQILTSCSLGKQQPTHQVSTKSILSYLVNNLMDWHGSKPPSNIIAEFILSQVHLQVDLSAHRHCKSAI